MKKKHRPARPHWQKITSRRQNVEVTLLPANSDFYDKVVRPAGKLPPKKWTS